ncbi:TonB-dependent receptor [Celerinatantimonas sp. MCCC 1A17872]|uniref:TonB-dependent receptor n=1 Tax=Celerinatantimonas sp. MCCC 1A17872 TaxID=3177514 RepID=UPI0038C6A7BA
MKLKVLWLSACLLPAITHAATTDSTNSKKDTKKLDNVVVTASADASRNGLSESYAGGLVARGQNYGLLGDQDYMDIPYSGTSYTSDYIDDIQAQGVGDILQTDPGVRVARGYGNFQETYFIRGFLVNSDEIAYNGLYGVLPRQYVSSQLIERAEIFRGASTFINGVAPGGGGTGGTINLVPKRAKNVPITNISAGVNAQGQTTVSADIGRRFGEHDQHGLRLNVAHTNGDTAIDEESVKTNVVSLGYDWRGDKTRVSADLAYQEHNIKQGRPSVTIDGLSSVPSVPKTTSNWAQPWSYSDERDVFGTVHIEHDFSDTTTGWFAIGGRISHESSSLANLTLSSTDGDATTYAADTNRIDYVFSTKMGLRGQFATGPVSHHWSIEASTYQLYEEAAYAWSDYNGINTNLYNPTDVSKPATVSCTLTSCYSGGDMDNPGRKARNNLPSLALSDTLGFFDDSLRLTLGARYQHMDIRSYLYNDDAGTGKTAGSLDTKYSKSRLSPAVGVVYELTPDVSLYANYSEALQQGGTNTTTGSNNYGAVLSPYVSKQKEIGVKYDGGDLGGTLALFTTSKPSAGINSDNYYAVDGKEKHRGIEATFFGKPIQSVSVTGGVTYLNAKQADTTDSTTGGKNVIGVAHLQGNVGLFYTVPAVKALTLDTQVIATGSRYADSANTLKVGGWTRVDLGAKYTMDLGDDQLVLRGQVKNLFNRAYWASVGGYTGYGYLVAGDPRSLNVSATYKF